MFHLKNRYLFLIILCLAGAYLILKFASHHASSQTASSLDTLTNQNTSSLISPTSTSSGTQASPLEATPNCLDAGNVSQILGQNYQIQKEQYFPDNLLLECDYQSYQFLDGNFATASYLLNISNTQAQSQWQTEQSSDVSKSGYRRIEDDSSLFAVVNPVKEISQVSFYGYRNQNYLQLNYTPLKEDVGVLLDKAEKLSQKVLSTTR